MKKLLVLFVLAFGLVSTASAQHRGGQYRGYNGDHQYSGHNVQRHNGQNFRNVLIGGVVLAGTAVVLNSIFSPQPQPVYYQQPIVVDATQFPVQCNYVQQRMTDPRGRPLYDQYSGQPLVRQVRVCTTAQY